MNSAAAKSISVHVGHAFGSSGNFRLFVRTQRRTPRVSVWALRLSRRRKV